MEIFIEAFDAEGNPIEAPLTPAGIIQEAASAGGLKTDKVDVTKTATFGFSEDDIHDNGSLVKLVDKDLDDEFSREDNIVTVKGEYAEVEGIISLNAPDKGVSTHWSRPKMRVTRNDTVIAVWDDLVMQQTGAYDGDATIVGGFIDKNPGEDPAYKFEWFDQDNRRSTIIPTEFSQLALRVRKTIEVLVP